MSTGSQVTVGKVKPTRIRFDIIRFEPVDLISGGPHHLELVAELDRVIIELWDNRTCRVAWELDWNSFYAMRAQVGSKVGRPHP